MSFIIELTTATDSVRRRIRDLLMAAPSVIVSESAPTVPASSPPTLWLKPSVGLMFVWVDPAWVALTADITFVSDSQSSPGQPLKSNVSGNLVLNELIAQNLEVGSEDQPPGILRMINTAGNVTRVSAAADAVNVDVTLPSAPGALARLDDLLPLSRTRNMQGYPSDLARYRLDRVSGPVLPSLIDGYLFYSYGALLTNPVNILGSNHAAAVWQELQGRVQSSAPGYTITIFSRCGTQATYRWKTTGELGTTFSPDAELVGNAATQDVRLVSVVAPGVVPQRVGQVCVVGSELGAAFSEVFVATGTTKASWYHVLAGPGFFESYE